MTEADILREVAILGRCRAHEIHARLSDAAGREMPLGTIFVFLDRLARTGEVGIETGDPDPNRDGRRPRYYRITDAGRGRLIRVAESSRGERQNPNPRQGPEPQT